MEFLRVAKRRSFWSEVAYIGLNILLASVIFFIVLVVESPVLAFALIILSKWRILAVRPRYWIANLISNTVDILVSLGFVILLYAATGALGAQIALTILYIVWLLVIKPRSKRTFVALQAGTAVFVGTAALAIISASWPAVFVVATFWVIGYAAARHALIAYGEHAHVSLLSLVWGFVFAELGWLAYHWTIAYELIGVGAIKLPQIAIISLLISFLGERIYASYAKSGKVVAGDIMLPLLLTVSIILVLLTVFNASPNSLN